MTEYFCPRHPTERLRYVLKGGAGYCIQCRLYTQAAGVKTAEAREEESASREGEEAMTIDEQAAAALLDGDQREYIPNFR